MGRGESGGGSLQDELKPYALLGGLNAEELWPTINVILLSWGLFVFAPKWKWTPTLSLIGPLFHAAIYVLSMISLFSSPDEDAPPIDFTTLEGVVTLFKDPNGVFVGWVHYVVFDALVGRMIVLDSVERGASLVTHCVFVVPSIFLCLMFGPTGFLIYMIGRPIMLPLKNGEEYKPKTF